MSFFLLEWNDEYLSQRIVAGSFVETDAQEILKSEIIKQLQIIEGKSKAEAELIYAYKQQDINNDDSEIDLEISQFGATLRYGSGYEERLTLVHYEEKDMKDGKE